MLVRFMAIAISVLTLVACSSNQPANPTDNEDAVPVSEDKTGAESHSPLTGEVQDEGNGRSIAVMINNHPKARPQSGLSQADIVYEILAEGNITRFLAIFQSERPENVGPVRSARDYYISLAKGYDSLFIAHGYSPDAKKILQGGAVDNLNGISYDGTLFKRASSRKAPHNSYITFENIKKGADDLGYDLSAPPKNLAFSDDPAKGKAAGSVMVSYLDPSFDSTFIYNRDEGKYERYSAGDQTVDDGTKDPVLIENLLIIQARHEVVDTSGRRMIDFESGGKASLIQDGILRDVNWKNDGGRILPYQDGKPIPFHPGHTWISVIPDSPGLSEAVSYEEGR
ncbi:DUF3048 domain-containing protein [Rossellomorea marisflavi]|uniref:DUF3048 domain-containing protein n=1 Tax=Rossellomorea marisflavi TaxID=189381 RepID=UPI0034573BA2